MAVLGSGVPQAVSRQCCAHLAKEACLLADADPEGFETLAEFCLERMQGQVGDELQAFCFEGVGEGGWRGFGGRGLVVLPLVLACSKRTLVCFSGPLISRLLHCSNT